MREGRIVGAEGGGGHGDPCHDTEGECVREIKRGWTWSEGIKPVESLAVSLPQSDKTGSHVRASHARNSKVTLSSSCTLNLYFSTSPAIGFHCILCGKCNSPAEASIQCLQCVACYAMGHKYCSRLVWIEITDFYCSLLTEPFRISSSFFGACVYLQGICLYLRIACSCGSFGNPSSSFLYSAVSTSGTVLNMAEFSLHSCCF